MDHRQVFLAGFFKLRGSQLASRLNEFTFKVRFGFLGHLDIIHALTGELFVVILTLPRLSVVLVAIFATV